MRDNPLFVRFKQLLVSLLKALTGKDLSQNYNTSNLTNNSSINITESRNDSRDELIIDTQVSGEQQQELILNYSPNQQSIFKEIGDRRSRLEQKCKELQKQDEFLRQKIQHLQKYKNIGDLSPEQSFRVGKQIEEAEAEREQIVQKLEELENKLGREGLYSTLMKLGYRSQVRLFRQLIEVESVAVFLIHGLPDYGQRWLLNRLVVQYVPYSLTGKVVKVDLNRKVRRSDVSALWRELGGRFGLPERQRSPSEVAEQIYQCWQTQNVLLIFNDVNCVPEASLQELIQDFWLPLVSRVRDSRSQASQFKLLMFLVDYEGCAGSWKVPFAEKLDLTRKPHTPIRAPMLVEFSDNDLTNWIEDEYDKLPPELTREVDDTVKEILNNSENGIPEFALEAICHRCGCDWYEESEKWLKL